MHELMVPLHHPIHLQLFCWIDPELKLFLVPIALEEAWFQFCIFRSPTVLIFQNVFLGTITCIQGYSSSNRIFRMVFWQDEECTNHFSCLILPHLQSGGIPRPTCGDTITEPILDVWIQPAYCSWAKIDLFGERTFFYSEVDGWTGEARQGQDFREP